MADVSDTVEGMFKEVKLFFPICNTNRKMKVRESPIGVLYLSNVLMSKFRSCIHPGQISHYFNVRPSSLEEYVAEIVAGIREE